MPKRVILDPGELGCLNLYPGVYLSKLARLEGRDVSEFIIDVTPNPAGDTSHIILEGHHRAVTAYRAGQLIAANEWEIGERPENAGVGLNLTRARQLHDTAVICGYGTIALLSQRAERLAVSGEDLDDSARISGET